MQKYGRRLILVSIAAIFPLGAAGPAIAQPPGADQITTTEDSIKSDGRYAVLVSTSQHLNAAVTTGRQFKSKSPNIDFQVVTCGQVVKDIATDPGVKDAARRAVADNDLTILACGMSIRQLGVDPAELPPETPVTENGLTYLFGLQEQGYKSIAL